jgi:predicted nucleic acid-binding protein
MRVFVDTNVVCDALLERAPWKHDATAILQLARQGALTAVDSALTVCNVYYVGRKLVGKARAAAPVQACMNSLEVLAVDASTLSTALARRGVDFEDDVQLTLAIAANVDAIVTRDARGFQASPISIWHPTGLLARLQGQQP